MLLNPDNNQMYIHINLFSARAGDLVNEFS